MAFSSKRLLVTGASGFLGSEILRLAQAGDWHVRAFCRSPPNHQNRVETFVGDLSNRGTLRKACEGVTAVVHAAGLAHVFGRAASDSDRFNTVNEIGTSRVIETALEVGVSNFVLVSSVSVYGDYPGSECDESVPCHPRGAYAISKRRAELKAIERISKVGASLAILRFATLYGEGDRGNVARLIRALERGRFVWPGDGQNQKSLIYKEDAARACLCALDRPVSGIEIFNVSATPSTMREIVACICAAVGRRVPCARIPQSILQTAGAVWSPIGDPGGLAKRLQKFIHDDVYNAAKFESAFNFHPKVPLSEGIRREVDSLRTSRFS